MDNDTAIYVGLDVYKVSRCRWLMPCERQLGLLELKHTTLPANAVKFWFSECWSELAAWRCFWKCAIF